MSPTSKVCASALLVFTGCAMAQRSNDANVQGAIDREAGRAATEEFRRSQERTSSSSTSSSSRNPFAREPDYEICWNGARVRNFDECPPYVTLEEEEAARLAALTRELEIEQLRQAEEARRAETDEQRKAREAREYEEQRAFEARRLAEDIAQEEENQRRSREQQLERENARQREEALRQLENNRRAEAAEAASRVEAAFAEDRARLLAGNCQASNDGSPTFAAVQSARDLVDINPGQAGQLMYLAMALRNAKQYEAALAELDRAIALLGGASSSKNVYNLFDRAALLASMGRLKEAFDDLDRADYLDTESSRTLLRGYAARAKGDYATASRHFERAVSEAIVTVDLAEAYWHAGRKADALAKLDEAIRIQSDDHDRRLMSLWHDRVQTFCPAQ